MRALEGAAVRLAPSMNAQEVANTVWGLARLDWQAWGDTMRALERAAKVAAMSGDRTASIRQIARAGLDLPLTAQIQNERQAYWQAFGTADQREGMAAFLEKRAARFNQGKPHA